eukprot:2251471-Rhodomonas_salina.1
MSGAERRGACCGRGVQRAGARGPRHRHRQCKLSPHIGGPLTLPPPHIGGPLTLAACFSRTLAALLHCPPTLIPNPQPPQKQIMHCMGNLHNIRHEYVAALRRFKLALADKITIL